MARTGATTAAVQTFFGNSPLAPASSKTLAAAFSAVVNRSYTIASGTKLTVSLGARFRIL